MKLAGVDVGGTFTDVIVADTETSEVRIHKVPSTTADPSEGLIAGVSAADGEPTAIDTLLHGTTIATNALLQHEGAKVGMITTRGYRDILHIARHQRPQHYSIHQEVPWQDRALIRRRYRKVVTERIGPGGEVLTPLVEDEVARGREGAAREGRRGGRHRLHQQLPQPASTRSAPARSCSRSGPDVFVTTSASVFPQFREYERFTTAAINGFVGLKVRNYLERLRGADDRPRDARRAAADALERRRRDK